MCIRCILFDEISMINDAYTIYKYSLIVWVPDLCSLFLFAHIFRPFCFTVYCGKAERQNFFEFQPYNNGHFFSFCGSAAAAMMVLLKFLVYIAMGRHNRYYIPIHIIDSHFSKAASPKQNICYAWDKLCVGVYFDRTVLLWYSSIVVCMEKLGS